MLDLGQLHEFYFSFPVYILGHNTYNYLDEDDNMDQVFLEVVV